MFFALLIQLGVAGVLVISGWRMNDAQSAMALAYGAGVAGVNSGLLVMRWQKGLTDYHCDGHRHLKLFHRSMLERFFVVGVLLAVGLFGLPNLAPLAMMLGFIVGQFSWALAIVLSRRLF